MPEKAVDDVMDSAVGAHFSGLRLEALRLSSPSAPSSPSSAKAAAAAAAHSNGAVYANGVAADAAELVSPSALRQPFVIGSN
jgi:uridine kinase